MSSTTNPKVSLRFAVEGATAAQQQLDAVGEAASELASEIDSAAQSGERLGESLGSRLPEATRAADAAAERFVATLRDQVATLGMGEAELLQYRAAELGVAEQAAGLIQKLTAAKQATQEKAAADARAAMAALEHSRAIHQQQQQAQSFIASLRDQVATQGMAASDLLRYRAAQLGVAEEARELIGQLDAQSAAMATGGISAGQMSQAMLMLPMQMTDVAVSIASGMPIWLVAVQQGGQLKDSFGGIGPALKAAGGYALAAVNPFTILGAAVAVVGVAAYQGWAESNRLRDALIMTGNAAGVTSGQVSEMAGRVADASKTSVGSAREILASLVETGKIGGPALESVATAAGHFANVSGKTAVESAEMLAGMADGVADWAAKQNAAWHFLTAAQLTHIRTLEQAGQKQAAMQAAGDALTEHLRGQTSQLSYLETAWRGTGAAASWAWDKIMGLGRSKDGAAQIDEDLARVQEQLAGMERLRALAARNSGGAAPEASEGYKALKALEENLIARKALAERGAAAAAEIAEREQAEAKKAAQAQDVSAAEIAASLSAVAESYEAAKVRIKAALDAQQITLQQSLAQTLQVDLSAMSSKRQAVQSELELLAKRDDTLAQQAQLRGQLTTLDQQAATATTRYLADVAAAFRAEAQARLDAYNARLSIQGAATVADLTEADAIQKQIQAQLEHNATVGATVEALRQRELAKVKDARATAEQRLQDALAANAAPEQIEAITLQVEALRQLVKAKQDAAGIDAAADASSKLGAQNGAAAQAQSRREALASLQSPLAALVGTYADLTASQAEWGRQAELIAAQMQGNEAQRKKAAQDQLTLQGRMTAGQLASYASISGAAKSLFGEQTAGYKALEASEKAWRLLQLAESMGVTPQIIKDILGVTSAQIAGDQAKAASATAAAGVDVAASTATGTAAAGAAVAKQAAGGDPYTALARMAAMAAAMAALGYATGAIGSGGTVDPGKTGTGTVLGDASAQDQALQDGVKLLADLDTEALRYAAEMTASLRAIEGSIGSLAAGLVRSGSIDYAAAGVSPGFDRNAAGDAVASISDVVTAGLFGAMPGGKMVGAIGDWVASGFGTKTDVKAGGVFVGSTTLGDVQAGGIDAQYYADVTRKKRFLGVTYDRSNSTLFDDAGTQNLDQQLTLAISQIGDTLSSAGNALADDLGLTGDQIANALAAAEIDIGKIDIKGLTGEQIAEKLNAVLSQTASAIAEQAIPGLEEFVQVGESYADTVIRVAGASEAARLALKSVGVDMIALQDLANAQGDVGAELVRESIAAEEAGSGIAQIVDGLSGSADELVATYAALIDIRSALIGIGSTAVDVTSEMIAGAGGLSALQSGLDTYVSKFLTEEERIYLQRVQVGEEFASRGLALPDSVAAYRELVEGIDTSTASGQELLGQVLALAGDFAELTDATAAWDESIKSASQTLREAVDQALFGDMTTAQQVQDLQAQFAQAYAVASDATASSGDRATAAETMADLLPKILDLAREDGSIAYLDLRDSLTAMADSAADLLDQAGVAVTTSAAAASGIAGITDGQSIGANAGGDAPFGVNSAEASAESAATTVTVLRDLLAAVTALRQTVEDRAKGSDEATRESLLALGLSLSAAIDDTRRDLLGAVGAGTDATESAGRAIVAAIEEA